PDLADEDVDGAVAVGHLAAPYRGVELGARDHAVAALGQCVEGLKLAHGEVHARAVDERLELCGTDLESADRDHWPRIDRLQHALHHRGEAKSRAPSSGEGLVTRRRRFCERFRRPWR